MSDDDIFSGDDAEDENPDQQSNAQQAQARLDREKAKLKKELEELRAFKAETEERGRQQSVAQTLKEIGLREEWAEFYKGEESTPDAVRQWAVDKKFLQPSEDEPAEPPAPAPTGYTPTVIAEASVPGSKTYSMDEFNKMMNEGQAEKAMKLWSQGRVAKHAAPGGSTFVGRDG